MEWCDFGVPDGYCRFVPDVGEARSPGSSCDALWWARVIPGLCRHHPEPDCIHCGDDLMRHSCHSGRGTAFTNSVICV